MASKYIMSLPSKKFGIFLKISAIVTDLMGEGHDAYHPVKKTASYDSQIEAAKPQIKMFQEERLPKYRNPLIVTII